MGPKWVKHKQRLTFPIEGNGGAPRCSYSENLCENGVLWHTFMYLPTCTSSHPRSEDWPLSSIRGLAAYGSSSIDSVFNRSQQTITSQPGPLRYVLLPTCSWSSSSSLTRSSTLHYFSPCSFLLSIAYDHNKKAFFSGLTVAFLSTQSLVLLPVHMTRKICLNAFISNDFVLSSSVLYNDFICTLQRPTFTSVRHNRPN